MSSAESTLARQARAWDVRINHVVERQSSVIGFGMLGDKAVVLKVLRLEGDESRADAVLEAFDGKGVVRVYAHAPGAVLVERAVPGTRLTDLVLGGRDAEATRILAEVIGNLSPKPSPAGLPSVSDWTRGFDRYSASADDQIDPDLVRRAHRVYLELAASQRIARLLHGDLHHENVLWDEQRGWLAVDPKGVVGEVEYELGAALRNPHECPEMVTDASTVDSRVVCLASTLGLDPERVLRWAFSQAVLSAIWCIEDEGTVSSTNLSLLLAHTIDRMISI